MKTIINIDGGLGRVITAIPALLKFGKNNPDDDWYVMIVGWDFMLWGIEELQERTFNPETKGMFQNITGTLIELLHQNHTASHFIAMRFRRSI